MFTMKLYADSDRHAAYRQRIVSALSFTIYRYSDHSLQITAHQPMAVDDTVFYVGAPTDEAGAPPPDIWYTRAIIENSSGKTTEYIEPPALDISKRQAA